MNRTPSHSMVITFVLASSLGLISCTAAPSPSWVDRMEEPRRAAQMVQDRQQELAAFRADMAAIRIAAAKKEAELQALRALVTSLRQENGESRQALLEANRTVEAQYTELAALKAGRDQLAVAQAQQGTRDQHLAALQETVATLSQDLAQMKQAMTIFHAKAVAQEPTTHERNGSRIIPKHQRTERRDATPLHHAPTSGHIIPAMHISHDDDGVSRPSRVID